VSNPVQIDADGWPIHLFAHPVQAPWATVVLVHAMMVDARTLTHLGDQLAEAGIECWRVDLRGHGESRPHAGAGDWSFDELVDKDYKAVIAWVRGRAKDRPMWLVGHSLGGLAGLAHQGRYQAGFDGIVAISSGAWGLETQWWVHWPRRALMIFSGWIVRVLGRLPSRWWGNPTDEAASYWQQLVHWMTHRCWTARDGFDYHQATRAIEIPCIGIHGANDRLVRPADQHILLNMPHAKFLTVPNRGHMSAPRDAAPIIINALQQQINQ
jgi:predicted alpha/beta hydrolase